MTRATFLATAMMLAVILASPSDQRLAAADTAADVPRTADGKPDLSGIWQTLGALDYDLEPHGTRGRMRLPGSGIVDGGAIPYQPCGARERRKQNFAARATADPRTQVLHARRRRAASTAASRSRSSSGRAT